MTSSRAFASYNLWSLVVPSPGQQKLHCQMRRGFTKAKQGDPLVKKLIQNATPAQRIGLLAQKGVYEFHHNRDLLNRIDGVDKVANLLKLNNSNSFVQQRVLNILQNYHQSPFLSGKRIILLTRGDEGYPKPIFILKENYCFRLYAAMDAVFVDTYGILHILDFKTGKSAFDRRQALVYLLAAQYLYPEYKAIAYFYNLEHCQKSELIRVTKNELNEVERHLANIANKHQKDIQTYQLDNRKFEEIFPANPGNHCKFCPFNSICEFSSFEVSV